MNNATLLIYLLISQCQAIWPVLKDQQTRVERSLTSCRHVTNTIDSLVDTGVSIQVTTELHTKWTGEFEERRVREMLWAIECHVLKEVCQTTLFVVFLNRTHTLRNVKVGYMLWPFIVKDVVS